MKKSEVQFVEFFLQTGPWYYFELGPVCRIPVCRNHQFKQKNKKTHNVGMIQSMKRVLDMPPIHLVPRAPWSRSCSHLAKEQEQRPSGNGDREAILVGAGLCDSEGEQAYTGYALHFCF